MPGPSQSNTGPTQPRPTHIPIPQPVFHALSLTPSSSSPDDPFDNFFFDTAPSTPFDELSRISPDTPFGDLQFHTAPTSPSTEDPASIPHQSHPQALFIPPPLASTPPPPSIPTPLNLPTHAHFSISTPPSEPIPNEPPPEDIFPTVSQQPLEITLDDEAFSPLEKIYLFSRSKAIFHRIFIAHTLPHSLDQITPQDAVEYVIPYISGLAIDEDESVKEALVTELVPVIWWFYTHCQLTTDDVSLQDTTSLTPTPISVQAFTPILATLLMSPNVIVSETARYAVVDILKRIRRANEHDLIEEDIDEQGDERDSVLAMGLFGLQERRLFEQEMLQQVVIGIGRLDDDEFDGVFAEEDVEHLTEETGMEDVQLNSGSTADMIVSEPDSTTPPTEHNGGSMASTLVGDHTGENSDMDADTQVDDEGNPSPEEAAIGRLSSMSLMAAVTASGLLSDDTKVSFVNEVEKVGKDPVYFVRREATFVLGALAKVVPDELVLGSLLPLFEDLRNDPVWHVRHSALFALPAILSRLTAPQRRALALETLVPLSNDVSAEVRLGVLEALGEVMYTFHQDSGGPPEELVTLFLGWRGHGGVHPPQGVEREGSPGLKDEEMTFSVGGPSLSSELDPFHDDPLRALVCAFNYPAVSLTLGSERWDTLRGVYSDLATNSDVKVRRTIAASLGELARIVGPNNARRDLIDVWFDALGSEDETVRMRAVESVEVFVGALRGIDDDGIVATGRVIEGLSNAWDQDVLKGWREREGAAKAILGLARSVGLEWPGLVLGLLKRALSDAVANIREVAIASVPHIRKLFADRLDVLHDLHMDISSLADSSSYRKRMTFVACQHALVVLGDDGKSACEPGDSFWQTIVPLAHDHVIGVRIGVARLVGDIYGVHLRRGQLIGGVLLDLVQRLASDSSHEVRSFILTSSGLDQSANSVSVLRKISHGNASTFSRPPPRLATRMQHVIGDINPLGTTE